MVQKCYFNENLMSLYTEDLKQNKFQLIWECSSLKMKRQFLLYSRVLQNCSMKRSITIWWSGKKGKLAIRMSYFTIQEIIVLEIPPVLVGLTMSLSTGYHPLCRKRRREKKRPLWKAVVKDPWRISELLKQVSWQQLDSASCLSEGCWNMNWEWSIGLFASSC